MHPDLEYELIHEDAQALLESRSKEELVEKLTYEHVQAGKPIGSIMSIRSGQKIPYSRYRVAKRFIRQFDSFFDSFYVIHIHRDPIYTVSSGVKTFSANPLIRIFQYFMTVPRVRKLLCKYDDVFELRYEDFVRSPNEETKRIYDWMGGSVDSAHIERVLTTKEPWECDGRIMPGLRYFDRVENRMSDKPALSRFQLLLIRALSKVFPIDDGQSA